eukprot:TRINITY_DN5885_c0_g1_i1.p1 TRINITY_DN5885_c0_g1~~TRINITY_DN5885_c0_g1_i1.p1  ORF type:complete len:470 (-),score=43.06 TRINITY_DN5885_c0_g1_i1:74-1423(-)
MPQVLTGPQIHIIRLLASLTGSLSIVGGVCLVVSYIFFKQLRTHSSKLILYLSIADLVASISWVLSPASENPYSCSIQSYGLQFSGLSTCLWQLCVALYTLQIYTGKPINLKKQEIIYHIVCWGIPAIPLIFGGAYGVFGYSGSWCWVKPKYPLVGIVMLYIPALLAIVVSGGIYIYVDILLRRRIAAVKMNSSESLEELRKISIMQRKLKTRLYFLPFTVGWLFGFINRLHNFIVPDRVAALFYLQAIVFPLQGLWNFLMYGLTERIVVPESLESLILRADTRLFFSEFLEKQFCRENLDFWMSVDRLKQTSTGTAEWAQETAMIYEQFVPLHAPNEVNLNGTTKEALAAKYAQGGFERNDFEAAQKEVMQLMKLNSIGFSQSDQYHNMLDAFQTKEAITGEVQGRLLLLEVLQFRFFRLFHGIEKLFVKKQKAPTGISVGVSLDEVF